MTKLFCGILVVKNNSRKWNGRPTNQFLEFKENGSYVVLATQGMFPKAIKFLKIR